jgi:phosphonate transport system substrate-binding protein
MDAFRRRLCLGGALLMTGMRGARAAPAAPAATLRLGVMPVYGVRTLMKRYDPVRAYVGRLLGQPVRIETAPDFRRFLNSILAREFDIVVAAAHFARIAQLDAGWVPLVQFKPDHDTLLIVRAGDAPKRAADLAGKEVAVIDRLAVTVMGGLNYLASQGVKADVDYRVVEYRNHASVVQALLSGASAMAVTTTHGLYQIPTDQRTRISVYRHVSDIPAFVILAAPGLPKAAIDRLSAGLASFANEPEGLEFLGQNSYTGVVVADETMMRRSDAFLEETRSAIGK